jgi:hypothetical protein
MFSPTTSLFITLGRFHFGNAILQIFTELKFLKKLCFDSTDNKKKLENYLP